MQIYYPFKEQCSDIDWLFVWLIDAVSQEGCALERIQLPSPASLSTSHPEDSWLEEEVQNCQSRQDAGLSTCCGSWTRDLNANAGIPLKGFSFLEGKLLLQNVLPSCKQDIYKVIWNHSHRCSALFETWPATATCTAQKPAGEEAECHPTSTCYKI